MPARHQLHLLTLSTPLGGDTETAIAIVISGEMRKRR